MTFEIINPKGHKRITSREEFLAYLRGEEMTEDKVEEVFTYHSCGPEEEKKYVAIRNKAKQMAKVLFENCPASADRTAALRKLRECVMTANASVALRGLV